MTEDGFVWSGDRSADEDDAESTDPSAADPDPTPETESPFADLLAWIDEAPDAPEDIDALADHPSLDDETDVDRSSAEPAAPDDSPVPGGDETGTPGGSDEEPARRTPDQLGADPSSGDDPLTEPTIDDLGLDDREPAADPDSRTNPFAALENRARRARSAGGGSHGLSGAVGDRTSAPGSIPDDASSILLVGDADTDDFETCRTLLESTRPDRTTLILVWLSRHVVDRLERLEEAHPGGLSNVTVVCRRKVASAITSSSSIPSGSRSGGLRVERVSDPRDLPKLGIAISRLITDSGGRPTPTHLCLDSITDLLQFADVERVFRFLHVLQGRIDSIGATAHYHIDADTHGPETVAMFSNLYDVTVEHPTGERGTE